MIDNKLYVQMLGGVSMMYNGKAVQLERNSGTKATQLLLYLLYHKGDFITREKLVDILYGNDDISNPHNNLKVNIFRLRRLLKASHLPDGEYIVHKSGMYAWQNEIEVEIDAKVFAKTAHDGSDFRRSEESRRAIVCTAVRMYTGEFLPTIASEPWVAVESVKYREMYMSCVRDAANLLRAADMHEELLNICSQAVNIYPFDEELHIMRISTLLDVRRYREAISAYDSASQMFFDELGIPPSQQMLELFERISGNVSHNTAQIDDIKAILNKDNMNHGAYYCNYPSFFVVFQFMSRFASRNGQSIYLILSTLTDVQGVPLELGDKLTDAAEALNIAIQKSLRTSDMYTRYSPCQYLLMLIGTTRENCDIAAKRLSEFFKEHGNTRGVRVHHSFTSGIDLNIQNSDVKFLSNMWAGDQA